MTSCRPPLPPGPQITCQPNSRQTLPATHGAVHRRLPAQSTSPAHRNHAGGIKTYRVTWELTTDAPNAYTAAEQALATQPSQHSPERHFTATTTSTSGPETYDVDLRDLPPELIQPEVTAARNQGMELGYSSGARWANQWRRRGERLTDTPAITTILTAWNNLDDRERHAISIKMPSLAKAITDAAPPEWNED